MNTFGRLLRLTTFGESHGVAIGGVLDGFPSGIEIDFDAVEMALFRRRPGRSPYATERVEADRVEWLSGIFQGKSTGTPIAFLISNTNQRSEDYDTLAHIFRPGHADYTYTAKYSNRDYRGGGRASARETAVRVVAGALASQLLQRSDIQIWAYTSAIGGITLADTAIDREAFYYSEKSLLRCPSAPVERDMENLILKAKKRGDSLGGVVSVQVMGVPVGWGEPLYDKLSARLAYAMMSIGGVKGFEIGDGFRLANMKGSQSNDSMYKSEEGGVVFLSNHSGGIVGGISTGQCLEFRLAFKPTSSISLEQDTITADGETTKLSIDGRHDPCIVPRAVAVVEAMTALVLADFMLLSRSNQL